MSCDSRTDLSSRQVVQAVLDLLVEYSAKRPN
jgi:hypothetical protein